MVVRASEVSTQPRPVAAVREGAAIVHYLPLVTVGFKVSTPVSTSRICSGRHRSQPDGRISQHHVVAAIVSRDARREHFAVTHGHTVGLVGQ